MNCTYIKFWKKNIVCCFALLAIPIFANPRPDDVSGIQLVQDEEEPPPPEDMSPPEESTPAYMPPSSPSQSAKPSIPKDAGSVEAEKALRFKEPSLVPITDKERKENCRKYEKQFISFHDDVFFVKNCKKFLLTNEETAKLSTKNTHPKDVSARVIASLKDGGDYTALSSRPLDCKKFTRNYVTYNLKYYWVHDDCKLKEFPDTDTLQDHKWKNKYFEKPTMVLEEAQFKQFKSGTPFVSILKAEDVVNKPVKTLPLVEACRNIQGQYVTYLDAVYFIKPLKKGKGCWREKQDSSELTRKKNVDLSKVRELSSDQALTISESDTSLKPIVKKPEERQKQSSKNPPAKYPSASGS